MLNQTEDYEEKDESITDEPSWSLSTNDDLKELCFLLDEERYKMHQLAEQWKHFGTSTIHKLECQILDYQEKLTELEQRQHSLLQENQSLKSLVEQRRTTAASSEKPLQRKHSSTQTSPPISESVIINDDPLEQQVSLQNMFDAIKTIEVYESIDNMTADDLSGKAVLKDFCHLVWKYLEERSKPKSSCLL